MSKVFMLSLEDYHNILVTFPSQWNQDNQNCKRLDILQVKCAILNSKIFANAEAIEKNVIRDGMGIRPKYVLPKTLSLL